MYNRMTRGCSCSNNNCNTDNLENECNQTTCQCQNYNDECECGFDDETSVFPLDPMLGQSYVPIQQQGATFKPCAGLNNGTISPDLVSTYVPCQSMEEIAYIEATNTIGKGCNS